MCEPQKWLNYSKNGHEPECKCMLNVPFFCVGCPFSKHINEELVIIEEHEPMLYKAAVNIFGKSYEYTAKYRVFVKEMKAKEKEEKQRVLQLSRKPDISARMKTAKRYAVS